METFIAFNRLRQHLKGDVKNEAQGGDWPRIQVELWTSSFQDTFLSTTDISASTAEARSSEEFTSEPHKRSSQLTSSYWASNPLLQPEPRPGHQGRTWIQVLPGPCDLCFFFIRASDLVLQPVARIQTGSGLFSPIEKLSCFPALARTGV